MKLVITTFLTLDGVMQGGLEAPRKTPQATSGAADG
jgi:hypothetical protein